MLTIISGIIGILSGMIPSIISLLAKRQEYTYDLELTKLRIESSKQNLEIQRDIQQSQSDAADGKSVRDHDTALGNDQSLMGKFKDSVRPIITYSFFGFFLGAKISVAWLLIQKNVDPMVITHTIWDDMTQNMFVIIMTFWFGNYHSSKLIPSDVPPTTLVKKKP